MPTLSNSSRKSLRVPKCEHRKTESNFLRQSVSQENWAVLGWFSAQSASPLFGTLCMALIIIGILLTPHSWNGWLNEMSCHHKYSKPLGDWKNQERKDRLKKCLHCNGVIPWSLKHGGKKKLSKSALSTKQLQCHFLDKMETDGKCSERLYRFARKAYNPWTACPNTAWHVHEVT
jgi:hypothetical protein